MGIRDDENYEKVKAMVNGMAENSSKELMNYELEYFLESVQPGKGEWLPTTDHKSPEEVEFKDYIAMEVQDKEDPEKKMAYMALVFQGTYERSQDENDEIALQERCDWAYKWYKHFEGIEDIQSSLEEEQKIYGR